MKNILWNREIKNQILSNAYFNVFAFFLLLLPKLLNYILGFFNLDETSNIEWILISISKHWILITLIIFTILILLILFSIKLKNVKTNTLKKFLKLDSKTQERINWIMAWFIINGIYRISINNKNDWILNTELFRKIENSGIIYLEGFYPLEIIVDDKYYNFLKGIIRKLSKSDKDILNQKFKNSNFPVIFRNYHSKKIEDI